MDEQVLSREYQRCQQEQEELVKVHGQSGKLWLSVLGWHDWETEKELILAEIESSRKAKDKKS